MAMHAFAMHDFILDIRSAVAVGQGRAGVHAFVKAVSERRHNRHHILYTSTP
jgi:hypothetical protein